MEAFHYRYHPVYARIKVGALRVNTYLWDEQEIVSCGEIGQLKKIEVVGHLPALFFSANDIRFKYVKFIVLFLCILVLN